jgi:hypothetical protein
VYNGLIVKIKKIISALARGANGSLIKNKKPGAIEIPFQKAISELTIRIRY